MDLDHNGTYSLLPRSNLPAELQDIPQLQRPNKMQGSSAAQSDLPGSTVLQSQLDVHAPSHEHRQEDLQRSSSLLTEIHRGLSHEQAVVQDSPACEGQRLSVLQQLAKLQELNLLQNQVEIQSFVNRHAEKLAPNSLHHVHREGIQVTAPNLVCQPAELSIEPLADLQHQIGNTSSFPKELDTTSSSAVSCATNSSSISISNNAMNSVVDQVIAAENLYYVSQNEGKDKHHEETVSAPDHVLHNGEDRIPEGTREEGEIIQDASGDYTAVLGDGEAIHYSIVLNRVKKETSKKG